MANERQVELAITVHQPYASLIMSGDKTIETRFWPTKHRGKLWIHASKAVDAGAMERLGITAPPVLGSLLGYVNLVDVRPLTEADVEAARCPYQPGKFAWVLSDPVSLMEPLPWRGLQRLWKVPEGIVNL